MTEVKRFVAVLMAMLMVAPFGAFASSHREAPITALDRSADITDWYAFVSYDDATRVTLILCVDPLLEPGNGPNYFPFDDNIVYTMKIDNDYDAVEDVSFEFRFKTEIRAPGIPVALIGAGATGITAPANAPTGLNNASPGTGIVVPPQITALDGKGSEGLNLRQSYTVTQVKGSGTTATRTDITGTTNKLYAVPSYVGPRTMGDRAAYTALAKKGIFTLDNGVKVFAGTTDDPFYIDLGATFDSLNFRSGSSFIGTAGVLSPLQDANDTQNFASDTVSGYNVNTIALEVPRDLITGGKQVIGTWGATYRAANTIRKSPDPLTTNGDFQQVQRMGNPLINELVIGTGSKDKWSMSQPKDDKDYANFDLDPVLARVFNAAFGIRVPDPPRTDLLPLVQYVGPSIPIGTTAGPIADMLRLNVNIKATPASSRKRMGVLGGDNAGYPNGRRVSDDVVDITTRAVAGVLCGVAVNQSSTTLSTCTAGGNAFLGSQAPLIGDGVNANDLPYQEIFPYVAFSQNGRDRRHVDPGETGCTQGGGICPVQ